MIDRRTDRWPDRWLDRWRRFWFAPSSPLDLGVARALFFTALFIIYLRVDFGDYAEVSPALYRPVWLFRALHLPLLAPAVVRGLAVAWKAALLLAAVGLATRAATAAAFVLGGYLLGLLESWGKVGHSGAYLVFILGVLALAPAGDAFALRPRRPPPRPSGEHTWPLRMIGVILALVFASAGVAKLRYAGWAWAGAVNLAGILREQAAGMGGDPPPLAGLGAALAGQRWLCGVLGAAALGLELGYPLALFSRRARPVVLAAAAGFLAFVILFLVPAFVTLAAAHVFWVPWGKLTRRSRGTTIAPVR